VWLLILLAVALFVYGALWWSRYLMQRWGEGAVYLADPTFIASPGELEAVYGEPEMTELDAKVREFRSDLKTIPCFACDHLPVFHLDPQSVCACCRQHEVVDVVD
jgi:hypothetical protein